MHTKNNTWINTTKPSATLEITPNADNARTESKTNEGLLIPRLSKTRVANIDDVNLIKGTLIFVEGTITTEANPKVAQITEEGFYHYDGNLWVHGTGSIGNNTNINAQNLYTADGTLLGHRTVNLNGKNLAFTGNGNIGVGTNTPSAKFHIANHNPNTVPFFILNDSGTVNDDVTISSYLNGQGFWPAIVQDYSRSEDIIIPMLILEIG